MESRENSRIELAVMSGVLFSKNQAYVDPYIGPGSIIKMGQAAEVYIIKNRILRWLLQNSIYKNTYMFLFNSITTAGAHAELGL